MATERFTILVRENGSRTVRRNIRGIGSSATRASNGVGQLRGALLGLGAAQVVRGIIASADSLTQVNNRLQLVSDSTQQVTDVQEALFDVANRTRSSFEATAEVYTRTALSARQLGLTQQEVLSFTEGLNQAIILSGATAQEARNGLIQFSQGLASNRLAGDELRAVLEQLPLVAEIISEELGVTRGALRELAAQGRITARDVLNAFDEDTLARLSEQFARTTPTIAQSLTVLENAFQEFVGEVQTSSGIFSGLARLILTVADNFNFFGRVVLAGGFTLAVIGATTAVNFFTAALLANPVGAVAVAVVAATSALAAFSDQILIGIDDTTNLFDLGVGLGREYRIAFQGLVSSVEEGINSLGLFRGEVDLTLIEVIRFGAQLGDRFVGVFVGLFQGIRDTFSQLPSLFKDLFFQAINAIVDGLELVSDSITAVLRAAGTSLQTLGGGLTLFFTNLGEASRQALAGNADAALEFADQATFILEQRIRSVGDTFTSSLETSFDQLRLVDVLERAINPAEGAASEFGSDFGRSFLEGFESTTGVQDLLGRALDTAGARSSFRALDQSDEGGSTLDDPVGGRQPPGLEGLAETALREQIEELTRRNQVSEQSIFLTEQQREVESELLKINEELRRKNVQLTDSQSEQIRVLLEQGQQYTLQAEIFERLRGEQQSAQLETEALNNLFAEGTITIQEFNRELGNLRLRELQNSTTVLDGFERGLLRVNNTINDFGAQAENTLVNAFSAAEDALVQFVQTGEFNFSSLVDSILADLTRLLARQALSGLLGALTGGGAGFAGTAGQFFFGGARAAGGPVNPNQAFLVGERGPELFVPPAAGNIVPNGALAPPPAPVVNVSVTNVTDPDEVNGAIQDGDADNAIINVASRRRRQMRAALGIS